MLDNILTKAQTDKLKKIGLIILTIFLAYLAADFFCLIIKANLKTSLEMPAFVQTSVGPTKVKSQEEYLEDLRALFPLKSTEEVSEEAINPQLELSGALASGSLDNIKLTGTLINDKVSLAIIQVGDKSVALSKGKIVGDYTLSKIDKNKVVFTGKDDKKVLYMIYDQGQSSDLGESNLPQTSSGGISGKNVLDKQELLSLIDPPERLVRDVSTIPIQKDGKPYGIKLDSINPASLVYKIGLRAGDILININNRDLKTSEDFVMAYQIFRNEDHIVLKVDRGGQITNLTLDIR